MFAIFRYTRNFRPNILDCCVIPAREVKKRVSSVCQGVEVERNFILYDATLQVTASKFISCFTLPDVVWGGMCNKMKNSSSLVRDTSLKDRIALAPLAAAEIFSLTLNFRAMLFRARS